MALEDALAELNTTVKDQVKTEQALGNDLGKIVHHLDSLFGGLSANLESSVRGFQDVAYKTQQSTAELTTLINLMQSQLDRQIESLQLQNKAIETQIRLAKESSRSSWIQNGLFFLLGVLIPVIVQLAFRLFAH